MSDRVSIRSLGVPGAAFMTQPSATGTVMVPSLLGYGMIDLTVEFSLTGGLPSRNAADDEVHWAASFHDSITKSEVMSVGITPLGKVAIATADGSLYLSEVAVVKPDGSRTTVTANWDGGIGFGTAYISSVTGSIAIGSGVTPSFAVPQVLGAVALLNGANNLSKQFVSVHQFNAHWLAGDGIGILETTWPIDEASGDMIACATKVLAGDPADLLAVDFNLRRQWMDGYPSPWAVDTTKDPGVASAWVIKTPYTRRTHSATKYRRRRVSWES